MLENLELVLDRDRSIEVAGECISVLSLTEIDIKRKINEHSEVFIYGTIDATGKESLKGNINKDIKIKSFQAIGGNNSDLLFAGIIEKIEFVTGPISSTFKIFGKSYSALLDRTKRKRSFQDIEKTYKEMTDIVLKEGEYSNLLFVQDKNRDSSIEKLLVQYEETDWEFLKRVYSHLKYPFVLEDGRKLSEDTGSSNSDRKKWILWIGYPDRGFKDLSYEKSFTEVVDRFGEDYITLQTPNRYEIGDKLKYNNKIYRVIKANTYYKGSTIESEYVLSEEAKVYIPKIFNENISGKDILAEVVEVGTGENLTRVRVDFIFDGKSTLESGEANNMRTSWDKYWFKFSTPYSGTNTGMYFMPEVKDRLLINFMDNVEGNSYAGESLRDENKFTDSQTEIGHKRIKIATGQQLMLSKDLEKVMLIGNDDRTVFADVVKDHIRFVADESEAVLNKDLITFKNYANTVQMNSEGMILESGDSSIKTTSSGINLKIGSASISMQDGLIEIKCGGSSVIVSNGDVNVKG